MYTGEFKTLDMLHREAPKGLMQLLTPPNPMAAEISPEDEDALCLGKEEQVCGIIDRFQTDCDVMKIDVQCAVQGGVVLECIHLDLESDREEMMFWVMFNTAFIRSNILMLNRDDIDILWNGKECFSKDSRPEVSKQS
ncbi:hypothetical protein SELMODRAFT_402115 [Selaginella moellendorffii]|uniref:C2 tensin-type domain-containing protein n=1 Tax=Selaginella moellendorffii TaxID=88036 RepID=D8QPM5_SELML|nr:hypothetical protein SELMODRAFT_402115 [Selaginella moellendorffii]